ncbi:AcrR family transcriptional regulator [Nocardiopsis mwathae]|uniref:AcrR family transcriptional regulator n=1 Tax=Nocardiopsis mwathae TaxID=1472723 RepID=A0A7W9YKD6_9ACTN|nr:AcrR family transcriptional regulator [Nocardiopsis mwathae]
MNDASDKLDKSDKRRALLDATCRVIARRGVRGLRVEQVAEEAGTSTALIYYHFKNRRGLLAGAMAHVNERADRYTDPLAGGDGDGDGWDRPAADLLREVVLREVQDTPEVRANSAVWGEMCAAAVFDESLRPLVAESTRRWNADLAEIIRDGRRDGSIPAGTDPETTAERLTALVEGVGARWLAGVMTTEAAHAVLRDAVDAL